jgi:hypothetical protein
MSKKQTIILTSCIALVAAGSFLLYKGVSEISNVNAINKDYQNTSDVTASSSDISGKKGGLFGDITGKNKSDTTKEAEAAEEGNTDTVENNQEIDTSETVPETAADGKKLYFSDTTYDGKTNLSLATFEYPFQQEDAPETYVNNKDFLKKTDPAYVTKVQEYAQQFVKDMFCTGYRSIAVDKDAYAKKLSSYFIQNPMIPWDAVSDEDIFMPEDYFKHLADWYVDNEVQADVTFTTDNSLIWEDNKFVYIRGELKIDPYSCKTDTMSGFMPKGVDYKNGGTYILELKIGYYGDWYKDAGVNEFQIDNYYFLGEAN